MDEFDYIIVGAGAAGCVLANQLSRDPSIRVLVLEAGGRDNNPLITMPKGIAKLVFDPRYTWTYNIEQPREEGLEPREVWIRGKLLGGSSSINGMIYMRGHAEDYDDWERRGAMGWNWEAMRQAFRAIEDHELGDDGVRGVGGALRVETGKFTYPLADVMMSAAEQMGLPRIREFNGAQAEGVGYYSFNVKNGRRQSAARVFLRPALRRANLKVEIHALAKRILFDGRRAVSVAAKVAGIDRIYRCRREVIVSCGTIESPKLLQLSGIGPADHLRALGIDVLADSPDVGSRMLEHLCFVMPFRMRRPGSMNHHYYGFGLVRSVLRYYLTRSGPMAQAPYEMAAFVRSNDQLTRPDLQIYMGGITFAHGDQNFSVPMKNVEHAPGLSLYGHMLQCTSEGSVKIRSADATKAPLITPNWLSTETDQRAAVDLIRKMRLLASQPALAPYIDHEILPGASVQSNADILKIFRRLSSSGLHGVGTCRIGSDNAAVVDDKLRVRGVEGLRVVDLSVAPGQISGNTHASAMAIAWRGAGLILEDARA
jgi:choline dehydrogenase